MKWPWTTTAAAATSALSSAPPQAAIATTSPLIDDGDGTLCFHRERNAWCLRSAQVWIALEYKGIEYETVRQRAQPETPKVRWADESGTVQFGSIEIIRQLDHKYPASPPLWPPPGVEAADVDAMVEAFEDVMPRARVDNRAGYLFCADEGFSYDVLPRQDFAKTLDAVEAMLATHDAGPFFCGASLSAADAVFAPVLERYACQLPCFYEGMEPRRSGEWPRLAEWYIAMDRVAAYACRVKGDAPSWRKVLSTAPWWPAGWPARGGPTERGDPRGGALVATEAEACAAFSEKDDTDESGDGGSSSAEDAAAARVWAEYASSRPGVAPTPSAEAAMLLRRNAPALVSDAQSYRALPDGATTEDYTRALAEVAEMLLLADKGEDVAAVADDEQLAARVSAIAAYLDDRMCVPRDMGAPPAAAIRALHRRLSAGDDGEKSIVTLERVTKF